ncbi:MAG: NUDIX domain-containing protein [Spirochaetales bacterium]|nr:NUDIX domain-containing protein [Spirochaetales bacterium]
MYLRNSAKAFIVDSGKLLLLKKERHNVYYVLPGGGQEPGETLAEAVKRECLEELGLVVEAGPLVYIREYIAVNHEYTHANAEIHQVEFIFSCRIIRSGELKATEIDQYQIGHEWVPLEKVKEYPFFPSCVKKHIDKNGYSGPVYLGDVN